MVETARGANALDMCPEDHNKHLRDMITAQSDGTVVHGVSLQAPLGLRLVPHCWHELLLSSPRDSFHFSEVFSNRLHDLVGAEHHKMQALSTGTQQMIVLRSASVVIDGPDKDGGFIVRRNRYAEQSCKALRDADWWLLLHLGNTIRYQLDAFKTCQETSRRDKNKRIMTELVC